MQAAAAAAAQPQQVPRAPGFALIPGATVTILDYSTAGDRKFFGYATQPLKTDYDLSNTTLKSFLDAVQTRSREYAWTNILTIPDSLPAVAGAPSKDLLTHYGQVSLNHLQTVAATYIGQPTRQAQNSIMLALCLKKSLTDTAAMRIALKADQYTVNGQIDGPCLLKTITLQTRIDTQYTSTPCRISASS